MFYGKGIEMPVGQRKMVSAILAIKIILDVKYGFVRPDASVHDSQVFSQPMGVDGMEIWGDSACVD